MCVCACLCVCVCVCVCVCLCLYLCGSVRARARVCKHASYIEQPVELLLCNSISVFLLGKRVITVEVSILHRVEQPLAEVKVFNTDGEFLRRWSIPASPVSSMAAIGDKGQTTHLATGPPPDTVPAPFLPECSLRMIPDE